MIWLASSLISPSRWLIAGLRALGLKSSVYPFHLPMFLGGTYAMYAAVPALLLNLLVAVVLTWVFRALKVDGGTDVTDPSAYVG